MGGRELISDRGFLWVCVSESAQGSPTHDSLALNRSAEGPAERDFTSFWCGQNLIDVTYSGIQLWSKR